MALDWYFDFSAVMALMTPVILIGGMTMGWFTPTEAAVAAVIWSLFLGLVRYRTMTFKTLAKASFDTIETTASVLFIVTAASVFAWLLTVSQAAQPLSRPHPLRHRQQVGLPDPRQHPRADRRLLPRHDRGDHHHRADPAADRAARSGIDPVHFGLIITLNLMIGLLHPPLGMVLFVLSRVAKLSVERTTMAILPWLVPLFIALFVITFIPAVTLWLPTQMGLIRP